MIEINVIILSPLFNDASLLFNINRNCSRSSFNFWDENEKAVELKKKVNEIHNTVVAQQDQNDRLITFIVYVISDYVCGQMQLAIR